MCDTFIPLQMNAIFSRMIYDQDMTTHQCGFLVSAASNEPLVSFVEWVFNRNISLTGNHKGD